MGDNREQFVTHFTILRKKNKKQNKLSFAVDYSTKLVMSGR
jgi:2'-5' RNA ligase